MPIGVVIGLSSAVHRLHGYADMPQDPSSPVQRPRSQSCALPFLFATSASLPDGRSLSLRRFDQSAER